MAETLISPGVLARENDNSFIKIFKDKILSLNKNIKINK